MKPYEIIHQMTPSLAREVVSYFYQTEREVYKTTISTLATQRKLRPVFVTKKSRDQQFDWVLKALGTRRSDEIAQHLLQAWLMKAKDELLVAFLDEVGVEHDGSGAVEELPKELADDKVKAAVDKVLETYPAEEVTVYLHMFQMQETNGWPAVGDVLENDPRLGLGEAAAADSSPESEAPEKSEPEGGDAPSATENH